MVLLTGVPPVGVKVVVTFSLPLRETLSFSAAVPAFLIVLEALPTVLAPALAVAESLPAPGTLTETLTRLDAPVTLTESVGFGASVFPPPPPPPPTPLSPPLPCVRAGGTSAGPQSGSTPFGITTGG